MLQQILGLFISKTCIKGRLSPSLESYLRMRMENYIREGVIFYLSTSKDNNLHPSRQVG